MVYLWYMKWYRPERPEKPESFGYSTIMEPRRRSWFNWSRSIYAWNQRWSTKVGDIEVGCIPVSWSTESDSRVKLTNPRHVERNLQSNKQHQTTKKDPMMVAISSPEKKVVLTFLTHLSTKPRSEVSWLSITNTFTINGSKCWMQTLYDFILYTSGCLPQRALAHLPRPVHLQLHDGRLTLRQLLHFAAWYIAA